MEGLVGKAIAAMVYVPLWENAARNMDIVAPLPNIVRGVPPHLPRGERHPVSMGPVAGDKLGMRYVRIIMNVVRPLDFVEQQRRIVRIRLAVLDQIIQPWEVRCSNLLSFNQPLLLNNLEMLASLNSINRGYWYLEVLLFNRPLNPPHLKFMVRVAEGKLAMVYVPSMQSVVPRLDSVVRLWNIV